MNKATVKRVFVLAITAIMLFSVLLPAASAETAAVTGKTTSKIYFRQNPTSAAKPYVAGCTSIPKGAEVEILGFIGAFYKVGYKGYTGYVKSTELTFSGAEAVTRELVYFRIKATSSSSSKLPGDSRRRCGKDRWRERQLLESRVQRLHGLCPHGRSCRERSRSHAQA